MDCCSFLYVLEGIDCVAQQGIVENPFFQGFLKTFTGNIFRCTFEVETELVLKQFFIEKTSNFFNQIINKIPNKF